MYYRHAVVISKCDEIYIKEILCKTLFSYRATQFPKIQVKCAWDSYLCTKLTVLNIVYRQSCLYHIDLIKNQKCFLPDKNPQTTWTCFINVPCVVYGQTSQLHYGCLTEATLPIMIWIGPKPFQDLLLQIRIGGDLHSFGANLCCFFCISGRSPSHLGFPNVYPRYCYS